MKSIERGVDVMNVLEKILEEIGNASIKVSTVGLPHKYFKAIGTKKIEEIIRSNMDDVPDNNDGWIPVSEKLPEEKGWYQCTCSDKGIWNDDIVRDLYYYPEIKEFVDNIRYETNGLKNIENFFWTKYVTAWQQQPKPYKAKEKS